MFPWDTRQADNNQDKWN